MVSDLIQYRKWDKFRIQCEEEYRRGLENVLDTHIAAPEQWPRQQVSQLRAWAELRNSMWVSPQSR
jgi:hypothetical protein